MPGTAKSEAHKSSQANVLSEQLTEPESFATTAVTPQVPPTSASGDQVPQVAAKEERSVLWYASDGLSGEMGCLGKTDNYAEGSC